MSGTVTTEEQRNKLIDAGKMQFIHWFIVLLSIILTFTAWYYAKSQLHQKLEAKFQRNAEQTVSLVKERMQLYESALWGAVAYIDATDAEITYSKWLAYSNSLKIDLSYPGVNGIGIIYHLAPQQIEGYLEKQRIERPDYKIHPVHQKSEYWPITYVEPAESNQKAVGLDMAFEENRYTSIIKARDTGLAQLTAPITLVQDAKKTPGFLFYAPFYKGGSKPDTVQARKSEIIGVSYAPFIMKNLMRGTLAEQNRHVSIKITDEGSLLFNDDLFKGRDLDPLFTKEVAVDFYGRKWLFSIQSNLSFREESSAGQSKYILIGGLFIDALLFGLFLFLTRANRQALSYADQITAVLHEKTQHLEKSNTALAQSNKDLEQLKYEEVASYVASHDLKSPLHAIEQLARWIYEDCYQTLPDNSKKHLDLLLQRAERMMKLLNDLQQYSRISNTRYENELINLKEVGLDIFALLANSENFTFIVPDVDVCIPRTPCEIVIRNLMSNAIKHHDKAKGQIILSYEKNDQYHVISVEDDGPGIPQEFHETVMKMFQTLKSRDKVEGSGMGLAMIKRIVDHYRGKIVIDSNGIRGTKIVITWPLSN